MYIKESIGGGYKADVQLILYETSNEIKFNYRTGKSAGSNLHIAGLENREGTIGLRYRGLSSERNNSGLTVLFYLGDPGNDPDNDRDGYTVGKGDCNDNDATINPGAVEICGDGIDNNCNGLIDEGCGGYDPDNDNDGYTVGRGDCNDNDATINPAAAEVCGDGVDNNCNGLIDENCEVAASTLLYFPLLTGVVQKTYFGLVNHSGSLNLSGSLNAYNTDGDLLGAKEDVDLIPLARREFALAEIFPDLEVAYVTFAGDSGGTGSGYCRFIDDGSVKAAAYPALTTPQINLRELFVPIVVYDSGWSTEIGFVSISGNLMKAEISFNNGATSTMSLRPHGQQKIVITGNLPVKYHGVAGVLLQDTPKATAATVKLSHLFESEEDVVVGAVLYHNESRMGAAVLGSVSETQLVVPYLVMNDYWWSSLAFYNPGSKTRSSGDCLLLMSPYSEIKKGFIESGLDSPILGKQEAITYVAKDFPPETYGLNVENVCGVVGVEFIGKSDALGCLALSDQSGKLGVFARVQAGEGGHWSGLVLLNPGSEEAKVTLSAYDDNGHYQGKAMHLIKPFDNLVGLPETLFKDDVSQATSIRYASDQELVGLVINNRSYDVADSLKSQLDILPALRIETMGGIY